MNLWQEKLTYSQTLIDSDLSRIRRYFPKCQMVGKANLEQDKKGADYIATLKGGAKIFIDVKTRVKGASRYWQYGEPELALESYSVVENEKLGWTLNDSAITDYILFTFDPSDTELFYILPFQQLRKAFWRNFKSWKEIYELKKQASDNWHSSAMFVPASIVVKAVTKLMIIKE